MDFRANRYSEDVARLLALYGDGLREMPLVPSKCSSEEARAELKGCEVNQLFPRSFSPEGALCGLYLYFSCLDEAHFIAQDLSTPEGSFWHGIMHRQEPDSGNAEYWFRQMGQHPVFPELRNQAEVLGYNTGKEWDPFAFIRYCEVARVRPGSSEEQIAKQVQLAEWQLLFDLCAWEKSLL